MWPLILKKRQALLSHFAQNYLLVIKYFVGKILWMSESYNLANLLSPKRALKYLLLISY